MSPRLCRNVFVYGTLRRGAVRDLRAFLAGEPVFLGRATSPGRLYDLGEYPGLVESRKNEDRVVGELFELDDVEADLARLDDYEHATGKLDRLFERRLGQVRLDDGSSVEAWVYFYRRDVAGKPRIVAGDYLKR